MYRRKKENPKTWTVLESEGENERWMTKPIMGIFIKKYCLLTSF